MKNIIYTKKEKKEFIKKIYDIDNIFKFPLFIDKTEGFSKYLNAMALINEWNEWLFYFKYDFHIPLLSYWHYQLLEKKKVKKESDKNKPKYIIHSKIKNMYFRQFIFAFFSYVDKLKHAFSEIYNFSIKEFDSNKIFNLDDVLVIQSNLKEKILHALQDFKTFLHDENLKKLKEIRNQEIHSVGGKDLIFMPKSESKTDWFREPKYTVKGISDSDFISLLKILLKKLDDQCTSYNTINYHFFLYLKSVRVEGEIVTIK